MIYPLTERRISGYDRRSHDSRRSQNSQGSTNPRIVEERRSGEDRRVLGLDRDKLLAAITKKQDKSLRRDLMIPGLISIVVTGLSVYATHQVTKHQIKSAKIIAQADRQHSTKIAEAQLKSQRLGDITEIFSDIVKLIKEPPENFESNNEVLKHSIRSLSAYGDEALPFLIQLRDEYRTSNGVEPNKTILAVAKKTIKGVLQQNQHNIEKMYIAGEKNKILALPKRKYVNYDLSDSTFQYVNLYEADFSDTTLKNAIFIDTDLRKANFSKTSLINANFMETNIAETTFDGANLKGATFQETDLRATNFENAFLEGAKFENCKHVEMAKFPMNMILLADQEPFKSLAARKYTKLLMQRQANLEQIAKENPSRLEKVYDKLNLADFDSLMSKIAELRESTPQEMPNQVQHKFAMLLPEKRK